ncbi:MAG: polysaccharide pyruvyl transferase CsaB [Armatimonadota bacterium]
MTNTTRIAALGYYGFQNLGDEAVLAGIRQGLGEKVRDSELLVLSNNPEETVRLHPGVTTVNRWQWREVADRLRRTDLFIFGGGSLLQDATSVKSVVWYCLMALLARRKSRRVLWWAQGIGPLQSPVSRRMVRFVANQADALTVRDRGSEQLLREIGVRKTAEVVADPAFALKPGTVKPNQSDRACIFAPRHWKDDVLGTIIRGDREFWKKFEAKSQSPTLILPMHLPGDREYVRELGSSSVPEMIDWNVAGLSVVQTLERVARAEAMVAMRLHALIFAARCGVPFVALSYDPKVDALIKASGQEDVGVPVESLTQETLLSAVERMRQTAPIRRAQLQEFAATQAALALRPADIAADLLY